MPDISLILLIFSMVVALAGIIFWVVQLLSRLNVPDPSLSTKSKLLGITYAFTISMLPWKKESAKLHWVVYLRGILFHLGIFAGIILIFISIFTELTAPAYKLVFGIFLVAGALSGTGAIIWRLYDSKLRTLSKLDDYISPVLITIFLGIATFFVAGVLDRMWFYVVTSVVCLYLPWSKLRHCIYFFFSRVILGMLFSRRGFLTKSKQMQQI